MRNLVQNDGGMRTTYLFDAANQVSWQRTGSARTTYAWDAAGNRISVNAPAALTCVGKLGRSGEGNLSSGNE